VFFFIAGSLSLRSQGSQKLSQLEDSLSFIQHKIQKTENDSTRQSLNIQFRKTLKKAIELPGSFLYPFDSLNKMAKITSGDKKLRIYNWNIPVTDGSNLYFCFLQIPIKNKKNTFRIIELTDRSDSIPDPEHCSLNSNDWYGALYYKIITKNSKNGMIYTLLGWEGKNLAEMQKIIEVFTLDDNDTPHFGKELFNKYKDGNSKRVIFKYSPVANMVLRYEEQALSKGKKWNATKKTFQEKHSKASMIVCDRLITIEAIEGKGPVLVPAGDIYDGFLFENDRWNFMESVDARNK
jgi:hypothetical protein